MCDELSVLNAYHRFEVQAPHDRREIQVMNGAELSRTQSVIAIVSGPMVLCAKWHRGRIWRLLSEAVGPRVGRFNPAD
jgi:hypothetical protein